MLQTKNKMRIAVTGGAGLTGQCAVMDLLRSGVDQVVVCDYDLDGLRKLERKLGKSQRVDFRRVDVTDKVRTSEILKGCDVVVNGVQYYFNLDVMEAALRAGVNYLDFGGLYHTTLKQISRYHKSFAKRGLLAIVGMGAQPGVTNLMAKHALSRLTTAKSIEIFDGWRDMTKSNSPMYFTWSPQTFFDESSKEALVFEGGKYHARPPFSEPQSIRFPNPVGKVDVFLSLHSELATLPSSFSSYGVSKVVWKEGGADFWKVKLLADLGLTSNEEISLDGAKIAPRRFLLKLLKKRGMLKIPEEAIPEDFEVTRVIAKGRKGSVKKQVIVDAFFPPYKPWKVSCSQYNVGIPGSIASQIVASEREKYPSGVFPPEQLFDPERFFRELKTRGIEVRTRSLNE